MKTGVSIVVWPDGLMRVRRGITHEQHVAEMSSSSSLLSLSNAFSEDPEPEKFPGFPPGAVGYCAMGHTEIWTKEVACPLCAALHRGDKLQKLYDFVVAAHRKELSE